MAWNEVVWIAARVCMVAMFPFSAIDKMWHWKNSLAQTSSGGLPGAPALLVIAILVEAVTAICIVTGWMDRPAAVLLAGFCVVTAFLYHPFWRYPDFFAPSDASVAREHFWQFLKNFGLVGGLLLVVFAGTLERPAEIVQPAAWSSHPIWKSGTPRKSSSRTEDDRLRGTGLAAIWRLGPLLLEDAEIAARRHAQRRHMSETNSTPP